MSAGRSQKALWAAAAMAVGLATSALYSVSRGKWSDPIIDSGREWIVPDALARGELLYRDVVYWFGPFTPYFQAALFRLFGSSFGTLALSGIVTSAGVLAALFFALRRVTGRTESALFSVLAIPALLFMPRAGGAILGMGYRLWHAALFTLVAVALSLRRGRGWARAAAIGGLAGLSGLCRTEWGLAAIGGAGVAMLVRDRFRLAFLREFLVAALSALILFGAGLGVFIALAGPEAVFRDGHVLLTGLPAETRRFHLNFSGLHDPRGGLLRLLVSAAAWAGVFLLLEAAVLWKKDHRRFFVRLLWLAMIAVYLLNYSDFAGTRLMLIFSGAPFFGVAAVVVGLRRKGGSRAAALVAFGVLAVLLSYRKLFSIQDSPYVAPPMLFSILSGAGVLRDLVVRQRFSRVRRPLRSVFRAALLSLVAFAFVGRGLQYMSERRLPIPGTDGMLSAPSEIVRAISGVTEEIRRRTGPQEGLVVFPEGEVLNYLSGRRNPLRHRLYIPGYLSSETEPAILAELEREKPRAIVIVCRQATEYGRSFFGVNYGRSIAAWMGEKYIPCAFDPERPDTGDFRTPIRLFLRKR